MRLKRQVNASLCGSYKHDLERCDVRDPYFPLFPTSSSYSSSSSSSSSAASSYSASSSSAAPSSSVL
ncbi:hypothetical protein CLOM_g8495 [Closterium sp. NIES-68]|nr:hypothetical protein CLOM_g8495 [Closterium sp. NIES-68]GJP78347.1 hypothetical protein CLOP_g8664 [Closterium sp. NIES-67]